MNCRKFLLAALMGLACAVGCASSSHVALSVKDQKAVLAIAQQIVVAANRHDAHAAEDLSSSHSRDSLVLRHCLNGGRQRERLIRGFFPDWHGLHFAERKKDGRAFIRFHLVDPSRPAYGLVMGGVANSESWDIVEKSRRGEFTNRVVIVEVTSGQQIYYMPVIEAAPGEWRAMSIPGIRRQDFIGSDELLPLDVPSILTKNGKKT